MNFMTASKPKNGCRSWSDRGLCHQRDAAARKAGASYRVHYWAIVDLARVACLNGCDHALASFLRQRFCQATTSVFELAER
jgi:hypothetical protein